MALFEKLYAIHKKSFHKISAEMPHKDTKGIVKFYYRWKKVHKTDHRVQLLSLAGDIRRPAAARDAEPEESTSVSLQGPARRSTPCVTATSHVPTVCAPTVT